LFNSGIGSKKILLIILSAICLLAPVVSVYLVAFSGFPAISILLPLISSIAFWALFYFYRSLSKKNKRQNEIAHELFLKLDNKNKRIKNIDELGETLNLSLEELDYNIKRLELIDRDVHLIRLMKGPDQDLEVILQKLKEYNVDFCCDGYLLVCFGMHSEDKPIHFEERDKVIKQSMIDCLDEGLNAYVLDLEDYYICLQNLEFSEDPKVVDGYKQKAGEFAGRVFAKLEKESGIHLSAAVSELHRTVHELPIAYKEVNGLFEYKKITANESKVIFYTDYYVSFDSWYNFGSTYNKFEEVRRLITSIQVGDFANAKSLLTELMVNDYSKEYPTLLLARCRKFGIIDATINAMGLIKEDLDEDFLRELDPATKIVNSVSYVEIEKNLNEIFDAIIKYFAEKNKELPPSWFENTISYIDKHYNDPDINVSAIADHFEINSAYYARIFKKYTGISPLDYIHKLRMKSAKKLMGKGLSVKDAATIVGYGNPLTMSRAFKRYEGITPGSFVKNVSKPPDSAG